MDFDPGNLEKAADSNEYEKFYESIVTLEALLGQNTGKVETQVQRIWPYGDVGRGLTVERRNLDSQFLAQEKSTRLSAMGFSVSPLGL